MISGKDVLNEAYRAILIVLVCFLITILGKKVLNVSTGFPTTMEPMLKVAVLFTLASIALEAMEDKGWIPSQIKS